MWLKFKRETNKKRIIIYAVLAAVFCIGALLLDVHTAISIGGGILLFAALFFKMEWSEEIPVWLRFALLLLFTLIVFLLMQTTISCGFFLINPTKFIMNLLILSGFSALFWMVTGSVKVSISIVTVFCYIIAIADHIVVQARSFEIQFSDFSALGTAAQVAGGYSFALSTVTKIGIVLGIIFLAFLIRSRIPGHSRSWKRTVMCLGTIAVSAACIAVIYTQFCASSIGYQDKYWMYRGSERNGFWVNIIYSASATRVTKPEDYDSEELSEELSEYIDVIKDEKRGTLAEKEEKPNVIVIMNETFSDVQNVAAYLGNEMPVTVPVTPFVDSLDNNAPNILKGHALASVYGGNTANSELEFLSGLSIQFIPRNTVAYNLYMTEENSFSIVSTFKNAGYRTIGMHPENAINWQRDKVYDYFNFDEKYFIDDFTELTDDDWYRGHVSDAAEYKKIIDLYENKEEDDPMFVFAVTMQNHGGYSSAKFDYTVDIEGYENYTGIKEYLSSIKNADEAFGDLVRYFEKADEKTIIVFFGDHQPSLSNIASKFFKIGEDDPTSAQMAKYVVPYVIWANYDIDCDRATPVTSINFLSSWLLDIVDADMTDFDLFVKKANKEIMAITSMGWYDRSGVFHETNYSNPVLDGPLLLYSKLQYNVMFDNKDRLTSAFGIADDLQSKNKLKQ